MSSVSLVLYCEGSTDKYFLPTIIQRTSQYVLDQQFSNYVEALQEVLEISDTVQNLGVPKRAVLVESDPDPKITLNKVVAKAESERRRKLDRRTFYESLALEIKLERLRQVPAYQKFVAELTEVLEKLNVIPRTNQ